MTTMVTKDPARGANAARYDVRRVDGSLLTSLDEHTLRTLASAGHIAPADQVRVWGTEVWRAAGEARGLFAHAPATSPQSPARRSGPSCPEEERYQRAARRAGWAALAALVVGVVGTLAQFALGDPMRNVPRNMEGLFVAVTLGVVALTVALTVCAILRLIWAIWLNMIMYGLGLILNVFALLALATNPPHGGELLIVLCAASLIAGCLVTMLSFDAVRAKVAVVRLRSAASPAPTTRAA